ncbi:MAG TPA: bacteriochlorophyll c-binding family protein [Chloroflexia bacterium]|nr:bacteriochlorophyll c-binding family protein [Chloroflexia bacterium]
MAGLISKTADDLAEIFEVQSDGWWMWVASMLRTTADSVERIVVGTYGVSSGGRVSTRPTTGAPTAGARFRDKEIESRFTKLG